MNLEELRTRKGFAHFASGFEAFRGLFASSSGPLGTPVAMPKTKSVPFISHVFLRLDPMLDHELPNQAEPGRLEQRGDEQEGQDDEAG